MPIYEYKCLKGHRFEELQKMGDDPIESCACGAPSKRILSSSNFALKGEGWYRDGYAKKGKPSAPAQAKPPNDTNFKEAAERTRRAVLKRDFGVDG